MKRCLLHLVLISAGILACGNVQGESGFTLLSRSLLQGPARTGAFFEDGFVLGTGGGIVVLSPRETFETMAFIPVDGEPFDMVVRDRIAYIAGFHGGLLVVDLSDPGNPQQIARFDVRQATACAIARTYLFVSDFNRKLNVFDITSPYRPERTRTENISRATVSMVSEGDILCLVSAQKTTIFTVDKNGAISELSTINTSEMVKRGILEESVLYLVTRKGMVLRYGLSDPASPEKLTPIEHGTIADISIGGEGGFILTKSNKIVPFSLKGRPGRDAKVTAGNPVEAIFPEPGSGGEQPWSVRFDRTGRMTGKRFSGSSIYASGDNLAVLNGRLGCSLFGMKGCEAHLIGSIPTKGFAIDLVAADGLLYVANSDDGVRIGRVRDDGTIDWIGHVETIEARDVALSGDYLVIADGKDGIKIVDVGDPERPQIVGNHTSPFFHSAVVADGPTAYIAGGLGGVEIYDIEKPEKPTLLWRRKFSEVRGIEVGGPYLYFPDGEFGLRIYNRTGGKPVYVSNLDTPGWNCDLYILGDTAYLADGGHGLRVADITDRKNPADLGNVNIKSLLREIYAVPGIVFGAAHTNGIVAFDVSDPLAPVLAARHESVDDARGVFADGRFVYLASGSGGVYVFEYSR